MAAGFALGACHGRDAPTTRAPRVSTPSSPAASSAALTATVAARWPPPPSAVHTDWCIDGVAALDEETCYVLPEARPMTLLIYLHGIVPPSKDSEQKSNVETVVARASRRAGVAALIPRGKVGLAPKGFGGWRGWPTTAAAYREHARGLVAMLGDKRRAFESMLGLEFSHTYLAGSSSGAYFTAALALHGAIDVDGFGAMSGGAAYSAAELAQVSPRPFYIGFGSADTVARSARALAELLERARWPVRVAEHPFGHGAKEVYLDEAFAFWREHELPSQK